MARQHVVNETQRTQPWAGGMGREGRKLTKHVVCLLSPMTSSLLSKCPCLHQPSRLGRHEDVRSRSSFREELTVHLQEVWSVDVPQQPAPSGISQLLRVTLPEAMPFPWQLMEVIDAWPFWPNAGSSVSASRKPNLRHKPISSFKLQPALLPPTPALVERGTSISFT